MDFAITLGVLALAEILFARAALASGTSRKLWLKRRIILRAVELVAALAVRFVPVWGQQWRFTGLVAVTAVLLVWSVVAYFARRAKVSGARAKGTFVRGAILSLLLLAFSLVPTLVFTGYTGLPTTGDHKVAQASAILIDHSRTESHETDGSAREVPVHFVYPADQGSTHERYPLIIFNHGAFGYWESNYSTFAELASHGYVVASIENPYHSLFTYDSSGKLITVDPDFMQSAMSMEGNDENPAEQDAIGREWLAVRSADMSFALDSIEEASRTGELDDSWYTSSDVDASAVLQALGMVDLNEIGAMGHSLGGATAIDVARHRSDVKAVIDIDGTMLGEQFIKDGSRVYDQDPYPVPFLAMNNEAHGRQYEEGNPDGSEYVNQFVVEHAKDAHSLTFAGTEHMDFTDLPLISPALAGMLGKGSVDANQFVPEMNGIVTNYFDYYLKGEGDLSSLNRQ